MIGVDKPLGRRVGALLAATVWAAGAAFLLWAVAVPYLIAATGLGPPAGTVVVEDCWQQTDYEGSYTGHNCEGAFTPAGADRPVGVVTFTASGLHRSGKVIEVWGVEGAALTERYLGHIMVITWATLSIVVLGWTPLVWLLSPLGRNEDADFPRLVIVVLLSCGVVAVLGCVLLLFP
ncbi:hypothetical protein GA0074694_4199 [Micromonospora inyonensis]|uniref:Uncharacterized protein n=1 Tax=Micromonospora inyonensis TaxID=47866 RepID=A0A1C6S7C3_9ACTN|nr:hypothetical protein GA0074694_4199 [Micromonospora inyonensis]